jgi:L-aspartate oxidase
MTAGLIRHLRVAVPAWEREAEVVVVGSGAAGMAAALTAARHGRRVLMLSKAGLGGGATPLAQGGLAAAVGPADSPALHMSDTMTAGAGLCAEQAVAALAGGAPAVIDGLVALGARLERGVLRLEGGHSRSRIVHAGNDATGAEVHRALLDVLLASRVQVQTHTVALDLLTGERGIVGGLLAGTVGADGALTPGVVRARAVVLATGGFGQAFAATTNPAGATGDGLALAARAGAELRDVEFVQFHPTVLWQPGARGQRPLVTEALRGAGAVLVDSSGQRVMAGGDPRGDLAPRDVVSLAMHRRMERDDDGDGHLWLDATRLGRRTLEDGFPALMDACRRQQIDPVTEPIPVAPGAHYACGGVLAGLDGRTSITGLYAVGEVASTGVHGANRLASNSLTEALLAGQRAGDALGCGLPPPAGSLSPPAAGSGVDPSWRDRLARQTSRLAGVIRDQQGLTELLADLAAAAGMPAAHPPGTEPPSLAEVEVVSLHTVSVLIAAGALARRENRGCHRRRDAPPEPGPAAHTVLVWRDGRLGHPAAELAGARA